MNDLLRQINETWELHYLDDLPRGDGCLAFVVDERCVEFEGIEHRIAVSFGDNIWPDHKPKGVLTPYPMPGRYCFGMHWVGTRGGRMALFDWWTEGREARGCEDAVRAEETARALLAAMPDDKYLLMASPGPRDALGTLTTLRLLPLEQYELVHAEDM